MPRNLSKSCLLLLSALALTATACSGGGDNKTTETPTPTPATTTMQASPSKAQQEPAPTVTVTQRETVPASQPTEATQPVQPPQPAFPAGQPVNAANFQQGPDSYWKSPTGRIFCGVIDSGGSPIAGCQVHAPSQTCGDNPDVRQPMVNWGPEPALHETCSTQGVFVRADSPVLEYGQQVQIGQFTAVSQQDGMYMRNAQTGEAFSIAVEGIKTFKA